MAKKKAAQKGEPEVVQDVITYMGVCSVIISNITHYS